MKLLDVVALLEDLPQLGLYRGQVGTIVEVYEPNYFWPCLCYRNLTRKSINVITSFSLRIPKINR